MHVNTMKCLHYNLLLKNIMDYEIRYINYEYYHYFIIHFYNIIK